MEKKKGNQRMWGRREFVKAVAVAPLIPPVKTLMAFAGEDIGADSTSTEQQKGAFKSSRHVLLDKGFSGEYVDSLLSDSRMTLYPNIKDIFKRASRRITYEEYKGILGVEQKKKDGKKFIEENEDHLKGAEEKYGVDGNYIAAIIGLESDYGKTCGTYNPVGVFVTMIESIPDRRKFGERELVELLKFCQKHGTDPHSLRGSYAGALGVSQFVPSSLNKLFIDGDGDGKPDPANMVDAIHSVAHYLKNWRQDSNGWVKGQKPSEKQRNRNWRAIKAYNRSNNYARAVVDIAEALRD
ncbi:lytic transglycosylase domain-containing protein [Candidatus Altiarchaeota archaeon]